MKSKKHIDNGFTLIELMIIVAIISILALIVLPKFGAMVQKSKEASTKGQMGSVRSAIQIYYLDNDQTYPSSFSDLDSNYINDTTPLLYTTEHPLSETVSDLADLDPDADSGQWGYVNTGPDAGHFYVQCTHDDFKGVPWSSH